MDFCPSTPAKLYGLGHDEYARDVVIAVGGLTILFQEANSWVRGGNVQTLSADAIAGVNAKDLQSLVDDGHVEGYLLQVEPFGQLNWYRITDVAVARDLLLKNKVKHYELSLSRTTEPVIKCEDEES